MCLCVTYPPLRCESGNSYPERMKFDDANLAEFTVQYEEIFEEQLTVTEAPASFLKMVNYRIRAPMISNFSLTFSHPGYFSSRKLKNFLS